MKILIINNHAIGDCIMSSPFLHSLHLCNDDKKIFIVVKSSVEKDLINFIFNDNSFIFFLLESFNDKINLIKFIMFNNFDYYFNLFSDNSITHRLLNRIVSSKNNPTHNNNEKVHKVDAFINLLNNTPFDINSSSYSIIRNRYLKKFVRKNKKKNIIIAPGSGFDKHKRLNPNQYKNIIKLINKHYVDYHIYLLGTKPEIDLLNNIRFSIEDKCRLKVVKSFEESFEILSSSSLLISNCNGSIHIGSLLNVPILGIYGPTNFSYTGPYGNKVSILQNNIECSPCYKRGFTTGCEDPICMKYINNKSILNIINDILLNNKYSRPIFRNTKSLDIKEIKKIHNEYKKHIS